MKVCDCRQCNQKCVIVITRSCLSEWAPHCFKNDRMCGVVNTNVYFSCHIDPPGMSTIHVVEVAEERHVLNFYVVCTDSLVRTRASAHST